ncbi:MAG: 50S ribosomal protein L10 [Flavobacteriaceae bacterium]|jgi:large subunit ribosomal protein L10|nr:50S ribosomal protein L10 [Flavobacteriaceae bacterium]CAI8177996.1 MAG: 50S ribosomal protein L10 [Flavobacteriaceae bacterium]HCZ10228.1 50S ribosomal protein L10 [Flavobacteriaceae bacterium]|tara:strand:+ start:1071 stop:1586 length:516 start_codon:yes stop_codon:yes gene_type:complete
MTKAQKAQEIKDLTEDLSSVKNLYLTDIAGLDAVQTTALRRACYKANIKLSVVKNTLLAKAMEASETDFGELQGVLKGNTSLMFSEAGSAPAKLIKNFRKKSDKPILKGAFIEEAIYIGDDQIDLLESIKSKEELIGDVIAILQSPAKNVISALQSGGTNLSGIIKTLSER